MTITRDPQFAIEELERVAKADPEKAVLQAFRTIEMLLPDLVVLENVHVSAVFDKVYQDGKIGELLYQQLKTLKRLRNDVVHRAHETTLGDAQIALGTLRNFYRDMGYQLTTDSRQNRVQQARASRQPDSPETRAERYGWRDFQEVARQFFEKQTNSKIAEEITLNLDTGPHRFDLVSLDKNIVIECKSYTWTKSGNRPAAKWEAAQRACTLLADVPAARRMLVFQDDVANRKSLAQDFARLNPGLTSNIEVWRYWNGSFERVNGAGTGSRGE